MKNNNKILNNINQEVKLLFETYYKNNSELYLVGGAIRNILLNKKVVDYDFASPLLPEESKKLLENNGYKVILTGVKYGTITAIKNKEVFEITTYRVDSNITDGRKPEEVFYTKSLKDDLLRRDFTINSMAWNPNTGLIDYFNGLEDLKNNKIVAVGNPEDRFKEDALRILRGVRFMTRYNFTIEPKTLKAMKDNIDLMNNLSGERIKKELEEILISKNASKGLRILMDIKFFKEFMIEIDNMHNYNQNSRYNHLDLWEHTLLVIDLSPNIFEIRLAALMHGTGKPFYKCTNQNNNLYYQEYSEKSVELVNKLSKKIKLSNKETDFIKVFVKYHILSNNIDFKKAIFLIKKIGLDNIENYISFLKANKLSLHPNFRDLDNIYNLENIIEDIKTKKLPITLKDLNINGLDLISIGYNEGKDIGDVLNKCFDIVLEEPSLNNKNTLLEIASLLKENKFNKEIYLSK